MISPAALTHGRNSAATADISEFRCRQPRSDLFQTEPGGNQAPDVYGRTSAAARRVAIVHEWLEHYAGSERVLEQLLLCYPQADLFAVVDFLPEQERGFLNGHRVNTSFIQRLPLARRCFRHYLGLMPLAIEQIDLRGYDLVISSHHAVAKGVLTGPDQLHVSYVHSPMRYAWDLQPQYLRQAGMEHGLKAAYARWALARLRTWDAVSAQRVDMFLANSHHIARRIRKVYRRDATVIHPPVDIEKFGFVADKDDYYLLACRFVPYKLADMVVASFARQPHRRLIVVGDGPDSRKVRHAARHAPNIEIRGHVPAAELIHLMQRARAFVYAAEEDFGITMVEAQACGTPVIAYGRGGSRDIVRPLEEGNPTGLFFMHQTEAALAATIDEFERAEGTIASEACRSNALRFSRTRFRAALTHHIDHAYHQAQTQAVPARSWLDEETART